MSPPEVGDDLNAYKSAKSHSNICPNDADGEERWSAHSSSRQGPGSIPEVCRYWIRGQCKFGADCRFLHEAPASPSPSSTPPHSPGLPDASTAPTAGPAAGPPVFLYPQMVYAVPVAGAGEYEPSFAAPSEAPALQQEVSFASYSTVSQDMTEYRHRSHSGVAISAVPSMESGWDAPPTSEFPQEYDAPGGVPARRTRSEDTIATTRMYERSAALAQRARTEVAELLDLVNTAHPQWVRQFVRQDHGGSPIVTLLTSVMADALSYSSSTCASARSSWPPLRQLRHLGSRSAVLGPRPPPRRDKHHQERLRGPAPPSGLQSQRRLTHLGI